MPCCIPQQVRVILDNVNSDLLNDLNARELTAVSSYNNRADVIKWTSKVTQVGQSCCVDWLCI